MRFIAGAGTVHSSRVRLHGRTRARVETGKDTGDTRRRVILVKNRRASVSDSRSWDVWRCSFIFGRKVLVLLKCWLWRQRGAGKWRLTTNCRQTLEASECRRKKVSLYVGTLFWKSEKFWKRFYKGAFLWRSVAAWNSFTNFQIKMTGEESSHSTLSITWLFKKLSVYSFMALKNGAR